LDPFNLLALLATLTAVMAWVNLRYIRLPGTIGLMVLSMLFSLALVGLEGAGLGASGRIAATLERLDFGETLPTGCWGEPPSSPSSCHRDAVML
jgi:CPA1 family monovalent cation:H+ antiporter